MRSLVTGAALAVLALSLVACGGEGEGDAAAAATARTFADVAAIEAGMRARFDRPDAALDVGPVEVSGDHAVADWSQGGAGGRALLERDEGEWRIVLCSGRSLRDPEYLRQARVPGDDAETIATRLARAEAGLPPSRVAMFDSFSGTVRAADMPIADPHAGHHDMH